MTIKATFTGLYSQQQFFQQFDFISAGPAVTVDQTHNQIRISDPDNAKNLILLDTEDLVIANGMIVSGTVNEIHIKINNKDGLTITGLEADASQLMQAAADGTVGLYRYLSDALTGRVIETGDKYGNLFEIGQGGKATINAGGGNDAIYVWHQKDVDIDGGSGIDTLDFNQYVGAILESPATGAVVDLAAGAAANPFGGALTVKNVENVTGRFELANDIRGDGKANVLQGGSEADKLMGRGGNDVIHVAYNFSQDPRATMADGGAGNDTLLVELSVNAPVSGTGEMRTYNNTLDLLHPENDTGSFHGGTFKNFEIIRTEGFGGSQLLFDFHGSDGVDRVYGAGAGDTIEGRGGDDLLAGLASEDILTGGAGADHFLLLKATDSTLDDRDTITDFSHAQHDRIDIHAIDANGGKKGNQNFDFIGSKKFDGDAGEVRFVHSGGNTIVYADVDGDKVADISILLDSGPKLVESDFTL